MDAVGDRAAEENLGEKAMNEDVRLNEAVKAALEDDAKVGADVLATIMSSARREARRRRAVRLMWRWVPVSLLAASVALTVMVGTTVRSGAGTEVAEAIDLLRVLDGVPGDRSEMSAGETLLAWQEAPCEIVFLAECDNISGDL